MSSKQTPLRIVLLGKTGVGKTSAMNTILGKDDSHEFSGSSNTNECTMGTVKFGEQTLVVIDTPGLFHTKMTKEEVEKGIVKSTILAAPGPHVFLYVLRPKRLREEDEKTFKAMKTIFGEGYSNYTLGLINAETETIDEIEEFKKSAKRLTDFRGGYISLDLDTTTGRKPDQISQLLQMINNMVEKNKGGFYSNEMFEKAQKAREQLMQKKKPQPDQQAAVAGDFDLEMLVSLLTAALMGKEQSEFVHDLVKEVNTKVEKYLLMAQ